MFINRERGQSSTTLININVIILLVARIGFWAEERSETCTAVQTVGEISHNVTSQQWQSVADGDGDSW